MIFRYSYAASAGNSGIVVFEIKNALKTIKNNDFRTKKCYFHHKKRKSIAEIVSTMDPLMCLFVNIDTNKRGVHFEGEGVQILVRGCIWKTASFFCSLEVQRGFFQLVRMLARTFVKKEHHSFSVR